MQTLYFVARTDVTASSGQQRVFGAFDSEADAAAFAVSLASRHLGDYAIFEGALSGTISRAISAASYAPATQTGS